MGLNILLTGSIELPPPYGGHIRRVLNSCREWGKSNNVSILTIRKKSKIDLLGAERTRIYNLYPVSSSRRFVPIIWLITLARVLKLVVLYPSIFKKVRQTYKKNLAEHKKHTVFHFFNYASRSIDVIKKEKIDIIESHYAFAHTLISEVVAEELGIPVVVSSYAEALFWASGPAGTDISDEYSSVFRLVYNKAQKMISPSWHCAQGPSKYVSGDKVEVVYSAIDTAQFSAKPSEMEQAKQELGLTDHKVVLFVGQLAWRKGPHILAKIAPSLLGEVPETKIVFVGPDQGSKTEIENLTYSVRNGVVVTGEISDELLRKYYISADVLVFPSLTRQECMGMSMKEAMAAGIPVVAFSVGGIPEAVVDGKTGYLLSPGDEKALAQKIIQVLKNNEKERMFQSCVERAKEFFDIEVCARRELEVLRDVKDSYSRRDK